MKQRRISVHTIPDRAYYRHQFEKYFTGKWYVLWNGGIRADSFIKFTYTEMIHYYVLRRKNYFDGINNFLQYLS